MMVWHGHVLGRIGHIAAWESILVSSKASHVIVACIDSNPRPARSRGLRRFIKKANIGFETVDDVLVVNSEEFGKALSLGLFVGFDEVWIHSSFPRKGEICTYPITSDGVNLAEEVPDSLIEKFNVSSAILGLGDGCGLNFITKQKHIADLIQGGAQEVG